MKTFRVETRTTKITVSAVQVRAHDEAEARAEAKLGHTIGAPIADSIQLAAGEPSVQVIDVAAESARLAEEASELEGLRRRQKQAEDEQRGRGR